MAGEAEWKVRFPKVLAGGLKGGLIGSAIIFGFPYLAEAPKMTILTALSFLLAGGTLIALAGQIWGFARGQGRLGTFLLFALVCAPIAVLCLICTYLEWQSYLAR